MLFHMSYIIHSFRFAKRTILCLSDIDIAWICIFSGQQKWLNTEKSSCAANAASVTTPMPGRTGETVALSATTMSAMLAASANSGTAILDEPFWLQSQAFS
eukprot:m.267145 g.267145  ORF g.267145 m.267145 type:complete len:101 (+) comp68795_c0_seq1:37-339(+)